MGSPDERGHRRAAPVPRAIERGLASLFSVQREDGSFGGDYGGALFLTPMYVALSWMMGLGVGGKAASGIGRYLRSRQNRDGSYGLHIEGEGTVFVTSLAVVALRLLGAHDGAAGRALRWLALHGGPAASAPWGKFFLALLGLYSWEGLDPVLPELWLLPDFSPVHPGKMWCHARAVYLPMAYLKARGVTARPSPVLDGLRDELYGGRYGETDWRRARTLVSPTDVYRPPAALYRAARVLMGLVDGRLPGSLREKALAKVLGHIRHEDDTTDFIDLGPVNKLLNTVVEWSIDPSSGRFRRAAARLPLYLWEGPDGVRMNGYNSLQVWDTVFAVQAAAATPRWKDYAPQLRRAHAFLRDNQVKDDVPDRAAYYRDPSRGGWPFSNLPHGWPITDCTAEGFKSAILLAGLGAGGGRAVVPPGEEVPPDMLRAAVDLILFFQNDDGGWASYEKRRGPGWYERLNPSAIFADIMTDFSYVECTSSCLQALALCLEALPGWREERVRRAIDRGRDFILSRQRADGSWEGSWGVCFTYGTWFAAWGLRAAGMAPWDPVLARAMRFLLEVRSADGGWGEHHTSCTTRSYVPHPRSQPVMTAWALLALMAASGRWHPVSRLVRIGPAAHDGTDERLVLESIDRAASFLAATQAAGGDWHEEAIAGVFNRTCMITYDNYRRIFPVWALGLYAAGGPGT